MLLKSFLLATAIATTVLSPVWADPSVFPTGTTRYDPTQAYPSYVLFSGGDNIAHLIDMDGHSVHEWKDAAAFSSFIDPKLVQGQTGHILVTLETVAGTGTDLVPGRVTTRISKSIGELDWNGNVVWSFGEKAPGGLAQQHHDWARLPNGNTLVLANWLHKVNGFQQPKILDDVVYEVNPSGEVVWRWVASDHLKEIGFTPAELKLVYAAKTADYLHVNNLKPVGPNHWFDAGDGRFAPDNLLFGSRNANFMAIIDRKTGKIVWHLGPNFPAAGNESIGQNRTVPRPVDQISGQHDGNIIAPGLPGAGNLLVFDNHGEGGYPAAPLYPITGGSRVLEINPVTQQIVWQYTGEDSGGPGWSFVSNHISSARRLPNGNTLIDEGERGRLFQVTAHGDIVWEFINPYFHHGKDPVTGRDTANNQVYRAQPVAYDWAPAETPHSEIAVAAPDLAHFRVATPPATP